MKKLCIHLFNLIPDYVVIPLIAVFSSQSLIYFGTKLINHSMKKYDLSLPIDDQIPIIPWFAIIYLGCYLFWVWNYIISAKIGKEHFYKFITNIFMGYLISGIIFCIFPTYIQRPSLDQVHGLGKSLVAYVYHTDTPVNLFPSMHCQISWYCYLAVRGKKEISKWYQWSSCFFAVLVCISTVVIKQHFVVDIFAGILIAEITYFIAQHTALWKPVSRFFEALNQKVFTVLNLRNL